MPGTTVQSRSTLEVKSFNVLLVEGEVNAEHDNTSFDGVIRLY
jgi:hypothetical protein